MERMVLVRPVSGQSALGRPVSWHRAQDGFSLVEVAMAFMILALLMGGMLAMVGSLEAARQSREMADRLALIRSALLGYTMVPQPLPAPLLAGEGPYLPCPDKLSRQGPGVAGDGVEDRYTSGANRGACVEDQGNIPWVTLGLSETQASDGLGAGGPGPWSGPWFRYYVDPAFAGKAGGPSGDVIQPFALDAAVQHANVICSDVTACDAPDPQPPAPPRVAADVAAIIWSQGRLRDAVSPMHAENLDRDRVFIDAGHRGGPAEQAYDDHLLWLSQGELKARLVEAGLLP